jgi:hypothetical protein
MSGVPLLLPPDMSGVPLSRVSMRVEPTVLGYQEWLLQEVIDRWPTVLPIGDFYPSATGLCSLGREIPVTLGGVDGFIDNLLVTDDGHLVIVETKLWRNPEALRSVIAQTLQYAMAVTEVSLDQFEDCLRRGDPRGKLLRFDETVFRRACNQFPQKSDDFEDAFDRLRRDGDVLLLIVADSIRSSVERLVQWMNKTIGSAPYKLGLVELGIYQLPNQERILIPKTLLRTREASRHVVTVNLTGSNKDAVSITVRTPQRPVEKRKIAPATAVMTEKSLVQQIRKQNSNEEIKTAEALLSGLSRFDFKTRGLPSTLQFGVDVSEDFVPLVNLSGSYVWFQIPMRAVRALGDERFVACKQRMNEVANFYRPEDLLDPTKTNALTPRYGILDGKVEAFCDAVSKIANTVRAALSEIEGTK